MARPLQEPLLVASTATTTHGAHTSDVPAVLLMTCSELLLATVNAIVKFVSGWPSERLMLVRFSIDFMLCSIVCLVRGLSSPSVIDWATLVVRGIAYCSGVSFFWAALRSCLPIGDVVVLLLSASPLFLVVSARVVLGEAIPREWPVQMALLIVGAQLINKPLAPAPDCPPSTALLPAGAAVCWAMMNFASRRVKHVPSVQVMLANDMVAIIFSVTLAVVTRGADDGSALSTLRPPLNSETLLVALSAVLGWAGLMGNVKGEREHGEPTPLDRRCPIRVKSRPHRPGAVHLESAGHSLLVLPGYQTVSVAAVASIAGSTSIPFNYAYQVFVFAEQPDGFSVAGATLVLGTTVGMTIAKHLTAKKAIVDASNQEQP